MLILRVDKTKPGFLRVPPEDTIEMRIQLQVIFVQVLEQLIGA